MKVSGDTATLVEIDVGHSGQVGKQPTLNNGIHNFAFVAWRPVLLPPDLYPLEASFFEANFFEGSGREGLEISTDSPDDGRQIQIRKSILCRHK
ncbi:MAG: hypothetical protein VX111_13430 [Planctomycetota bacterium]|nr:hypothetical protein [Planctomycetota bacterium]